MEGIDMRTFILVSVIGTDKNPTRVALMKSSIIQNITNKKTS